MEICFRTIYATKSMKTLRLAALWIMPLALQGCAGIMDMYPKKASEPAPPNDSQYRALSLRGLLSSGVSGRLRCVARFEGIEDMVLDLPEAYHEWIRLSLSDPESSLDRTTNVVAPQNQRALVSSLRRGDRIEIFVFVVPPEEAMVFEGETPKGSPLLRVEKVRRYVEGRKETPPFEPRSLKPAEYIDVRKPGAFIRLEPDGTCRLSYAGKETAGTYLRQGNKVTFHLAGGKTTHAWVGGNVLTDPEGNEWVESGDSARREAP